MRITNDSIVSSGRYEGLLWEDVVVFDPGYIAENYWDLGIPEDIYSKAIDILDTNELSDPYEDYNYAEQQARAFGFTFNGDE